MDSARWVGAVVGEKRENKSRLPDIFPINDGLGKLKQLILSPQRGLEFYFRCSRDPKKKTLRGFGYHRCDALNLRCILQKMKVKDGDGIVRQLKNGCV